MPLAVVKLEELEAERQLIERAQAGDEDAFTALYEANYERVFKFCYKYIGKRTDAEDLTAEVFVSMWRNLGTYQWKGIPFFYWLMIIARNKINDFLRRVKKNGPQYELHENLIDFGAFNPEKRGELISDLTTLEQALEWLTDLQRQVIYHRFIFGLTLKETALVLGKSINNVSRIQKTALNKMRRFLIREGHYGGYP